MRMNFCYMLLDSLNKFAEMKFSTGDSMQATPFICAVQGFNFMVAKLLWHAGGEPLCDDSWYNNDNPPKLLLQDSFNEWLTEQDARPKELFLLLRIFLRRLLKQPFWCSVSELPLPNYLKLSLGLPEITS